MDFNSSPHLFVDLVAVFFSCHFFREVPLLTLRFLELFRELRLFVLTYFYLLSFLKLLGIFEISSFLATRFQRYRISYCASFIVSVFALETNTTSASSNAWTNTVGLYTYAYICCSNFVSHIRFKIIMSTSYNLLR